jgi:hypothetical protein
MTSILASIFEMAFILVGELIGLCYLDALGHEVFQIDISDINFGRRVLLRKSSGASVKSTQIMTSVPFHLDRPI